jgi:hypothetical protein
VDLAFVGEVAGEAILPSFSAAGAMMYSRHSIIDSIKIKTWCGVETFLTASTAILYTESRVCTRTRALARVPSVED